MRTASFALVLGFLVVGLGGPAFGQSLLKSEPLVLAPYESVFVKDASCPGGRVLKVTGAIRGVHRRKSCVLLPSEQASLSSARR